MRWALCRIMKKHLTKFLTAFICILTLELNAQSKIDTTDTDIKFDITKEISKQLTSDYNAIGARKDIKKKNIRILFPGGFGGMPDFDNQKDIDFQKKYSVDFFSQGCIRMGEDENEEEYNLTIFKYLDKKFGKSWRSEIRSDAIGLK